MVVAIVFSVVWWVVVARPLMRWGACEVLRPGRCPADVRIIAQGITSGIRGAGDALAPET
jgi:hypothetical protein